MFELKKLDANTRARRGVVKTRTQEIQTPVFMPVGTLGSVKSLDPRDLDELGAEIVLANAYHLMLRPGDEQVRDLGGLHQMCGYKNQAILTDSGGYQVYSLAHRRKIKEEGVTFQSHIDGSKHFFSPERAMDIQRSIGGDIIMAFDECPPYPCDYRYAKDSMEMTHRWLQRCADHFDSTPDKYGYTQNLFPIVQGSTYEDLRKASAETIASFDRPGNAIGGLSVGEKSDDMYRITELCCDILPKEKPRYLMGVGTPVNLLECIALGVDMFDCVLPTRNARHGLLYTRNGQMNIKNLKWKNDHSPIDPDGPCYTSRFHTKAYLRHLIHSGELLGGQLASIHNLAFFLWLVKEARQHILAGDFARWKDEMVPKLQQRL